MIFRFMMFSERLEHRKHAFQHLQGTVMVQKHVQFRGFSGYQCAVDRFRRYARGTDFSFVKIKK